MKSFFDPAHFLLYTSTASKKTIFEVFNSLRVQIRNLKENIQQGKIHIGPVGDKNKLSLMTAASVEAKSQKIKVEKTLTERQHIDYFSKLHKHFGMQYAGY